MFMPHGSAPVPPDQHSAQVSVQETDANLGHDAQGKLSHRDVVEGMRALRRRVKTDSMSVREMVEAGRRF